MDKAAISAQLSEKTTLTLPGIIARLHRRFLKPELTAEAQMSAEKRALLRELDETLHDLRCARLNFEQASSPEIIEAAIYEIKSAESRYGFLLRKAKQVGLTGSAANTQR